nr:late embryogenesis abundant protein D-34-like [Ipomoea batatas]
MSQEQPRRPEQMEPVKYGDVFGVSGELADKPIAPQDAAMMQSAETAVLGQTQKGGPAAAMQAAAKVNVRAGVVSPDDVSSPAGNQGVTVTETDVPGSRIITESVAGQVVGQYVEAMPLPNEAGGGNIGGLQAGITIGQALEASAHALGSKAVDRSDAAAIQAAEVRATGTNVITPGGVAATAQSAAAYNEGLIRDQDKVKLGNVLADATQKLPADKIATREDAEGVASAQQRNNINMSSPPGGVAASVAAAARLNERGL